MEVSGKLNERLGAHQGVFQEYSARGASRATTLFTVLVLVSKGNRAAILGRPPSVAIFQQVVGNVYAFLCIRITRLISFGVCAGFFSFRGSRGGGYTSLEPRKLQPLWLPRRL